MSQSTWYRLAWTLIPKLPSRFVEGTAGFIGNVVAVLNGGSVQQLRKNLHHLTGKEPTAKEVRYAVRSYFRCFAQQFSLSGWGEEELRTRCVYPQAAQTRKMMEDGPVVLALTHSGNWDLAGAWFCQNFGGIVTVAEKLDPPELFDHFVSFRESLGMEIIGVGKGEHIFESLVDKVAGRSLLVPLLADRDISGSGIEVTLGSGNALVAAGPAALALRLGRPLIAGHMVYRKERGRWILHAQFTDPIAMPSVEEGETEVEALTKAWVRAVEPAMVRGALDWHMMQRLYVSDLDPERLQRAQRRHQDREEETP